MIIFVYTLIFIISVVVAKNKFKNWINVVSIFTALWCIFGSISSYGFFSMNIPSITIHQYAWLFVISFNFVFLLRIKAYIRVNEYDNIDINNRKHSTAGVIQILALLMSIPLLIKMVTTLISYGSLTTLRQFFFSGEVFSSIYIDLLFRQLPYGMLEGLTVYYAYYSITHLAYKFLFVSLIDTFLATLVSGGRYPIMLLVYSLIVLLILYRNKDFRINVQNKKVKVAIVITVLFMAAVTIYRGQSIFKSIVVYFSGSFSFLDRIIAMPEQFALNERTHGYLLFGAIFEPIVLFLKVLGFTDAKVPQWYFNTYCQQFYNIGTAFEPIYFNNNTSILYYLIRDFGVIGIVIGGIIIGIVLSTLYNNLQKGSTFSYLAYIYMCNVLFNTVMTYQFFGTIPLFIFLVFFLCTRKKKIVLKIR